MSKKTTKQDLARTFQREFETWSYSYSYAPTFIQGDFIHKSGMTIQTLNDNQYFTVTYTSKVGNFASRRYTSPKTDDLEFMREDIFEGYFESMKKFGRGKRVDGMSVMNPVRGETILGSVLEFFNILEEEEMDVVGCDVARALNAWRIWKRNIESDLDAYI